MKTERSTFSVSFFVKKNAVKKSNGKAPIVARITINGKVSQFSTKLEIAPTDWSVAKAKAINGKDAASINRTLEDIKARLISLYHQFISQIGMITAEKLKNNFLGLDEKYDMILDLFDRHNKDLKKMVGVDKSDSTYKKYNLARRRVEEFLQYHFKVTDMAVRDINLMFIKDYELFLRVNCKLSHNVAAKMIQYLKKIVMFAFNTGIIQKNPFATYKIRVEKVDKGFLTQEELNRIAQKKLTNERLENVRDIFIMACFTGLSYIDIKNLSATNLRIGMDGNQWVMGKRIKTGVDYAVPMMKIPLMILEKYDKRKSDEGKLLNVISNQKLNSYLKELADICGIDKNLTFHMARHTFATTVTLGNGVSMEAVSGMLGHSDIKTTQIYARITNQKIESDTKHLKKKFNKTENLLAQVI